MGTSKSTRSIKTDETIEPIYQKYQLLKQEVDSWRQERGAYWKETISLSENPPYLPLQDLPPEAVIELWQRINSAARITVSDSELREIWERFKKDQTAMDEETAARFQMAVSGVACLAGEKAYEKGVLIPSGVPHDAISCPVCNEAVALAVLTPPGGHRVMHCSSCSFEWPVKRIGCLSCGSQDAKQQIFLTNDAFPGIEIAVCQVCGHSFKEIDARKLSSRDYIWEDLRTLPLNFAVEQWLAEQTKKYKPVH
ncbi:MAG: formate dehydrogenase accessory protein FdhE [Firmicutes bacterium]|nr:formate dehydrogenase accessory protein FdhE [Bacillota bacterium]